MYYTIYKITNTIDGIYYIGMHQTKNLNDGYFGSGKRLKYAVNKYGKENFTKEILFVFDNEQDMRNKEKELVTVSEETYNLLEGGKGGWGYINKNDIPKFHGKKHTDTTKEKLRNILLSREQYIFTEADRKKVSLALKQKYINDPEYKKKISRKKSVEEKEKISLKMKEYWKTKNAGVV